MMRSPTRTEEACRKASFAANKFDWDAHNARLDAAMARLETALTVDAQIARAGLDMVRDVREMLAEAVQ